MQMMPHVELTCKGFARNSELEALLLLSWRVFIKLRTVMCFIC